MDPATLTQIAQQATNILVPAFSALCIAGKPAVDKGKEVLVDLIYEKAFEKLGSESGKRAQVLLEKISPKMSASLEKALTKVSQNSDDLKAKEEIQQDLVELFKENPGLVREIEIIVNINIDIGVVKQLISGNGNVILNLENIKGEEFIKIMEYMGWKRQEELKQKVLISYNPSVLPDYPESLINFVTENRSEELSSALKHLQKNKILLFSGIAGIGKTTLARVLVNFRPTNIPEPFWFNFYHNRDAKLEDVLEALAAYLEAPEILGFKGKRQAENTDLNRLTEELRKRDSLWLVFDDLSYIIDEEQNFIDSGLGLLFEALKDNAHNAKIILTSRVMPLLDKGEYLIDELEDENKQQIRGLKQNFAISYLKENGFESVELNVLESLVKSIDGHPFSLKLLAGLAKKHKAEDILKDLSLFRKHQKDRIKNARFLFDKLVGGEIELLERISVYRQPEPLEAIKKMFTDSISIDSVDTLLDKSLLETDHNGNYWLHPLVQEFSYEDLKNKKEAHMFAVKYYLSLQLPENPAKKEDLQPAIEAHYHACEAGEYDLAEIITEKFDFHNLLDLWGNPRALIEIYGKLLPENHFKDKPILKNKTAHGAVLGNLGTAYSRLGETRKAIEYYEKALKISLELRDKHGEGNNLGNLGNAYSQLGESRKAIEYYEKALKISLELRDKHGEGYHLGNLGTAYRYLGKVRKAIEYYEKSLDISKETENKRAEGNHLGNLGLAYKDLEEYAKAIEYYEKALEISKEIGDKRGKENRFGNLGLTYNQLREPRKAIEYLEQALEISKEIGDRHGEGNHLGDLGNAYSQLGESRKAIEYYEKALKISKEIENKRLEGNCLGNLGSEYSDLGEQRKAIEFLKESIALGKAIGDLRIISFCEQKLKELEGSDD